MSIGLKNDVAKPHKKGGRKPIRGETMIQDVFRIDVKTRDLLNEMASRTGKPKGAYIRDGIDLLLEKHSELVAQIRADMEANRSEQ
jgi:predicted DNA-binding protein